MAAREYGAKYPVLLPDSSLPGDSRAEHGFANRGDAQNLSAVRLQQFIRLAGEIAFHPELLSRAERMEELLPHARFRQMATAKQSSKPLATSKVQLATNNNVVRTAEGSAFDLDSFQSVLKLPSPKIVAGCLLETSCRILELPERAVNCGSHTGERRVECSLSTQTKSGGSRHSPRQSKAAATRCSRTTRSENAATNCTSKVVELDGLRVSQNLAWSFLVVEAKKDWCAWRRFSMTMKANRLR